MQTIFPGSLFTLYQVRNSGQLGGKKKALIGIIQKSLELSPSRTMFRRLSQFTDTCGY